MSVHPFTGPAFCTPGSQGCAGACPSCYGARGREPQRGRQPIAALTDKDTHITLTLTEFTLDVRGRVSDCPEENPRENMQTPHRKAGAELRTPNLLPVRRQC